MSNEQFNELTFEKLQSEMTTQIQNMIPEMEKQIQSMRPMVSIILKEFGSYITEAANVTKDAIGLGTSSQPSGVSTQKDFQEGETIAGAISNLLNSMSGIMVQASSGGTSTSSTQFPTEGTAIPITGEQNLWDAAEEAKRKLFAAQGITYIKKPFTIQALRDITTQTDVNNFQVTVNESLQLSPTVATTPTTFGVDTQTAGTMNIEGTQYNKGEATLKIQSLDKIIQSRASSVTTARTWINMYNSWAPAVQTYNAPTYQANLQKIQAQESNISALLSWRNLFFKTFGTWA